MNAIVFLIIAIASEITATTALKLSEGFTRWLPGLVSIIGYGIAFYALSMALRGLPLGIAYAIWSAVGTVGAVVLGILIWKQPISPLGIFGIALIVVGVVLLNVVSNGARAA
ncbi:MAG: multidrug efflux SMR transporter [Pleurocapsa minor GSE-CHR-MK-17-07R]|nr:multidrug efflux SMR transporter [Pleurocapsa minor GSE-CHR-MK 17-07R]